MFLIFKPPYSLQQAQLVDPDGFKKPKRRYDTQQEIELAVKILTDRKPKQRRKRKKQLDIKALIEQQLDIGATIDSAVQHVTTQQFLEPQQLTLTPEARAQIDSILTNYLAELRDLQIKVKKQKDNKIKVLMLFAMMDDDEQV